ncbi:hypothetical protein [Pseudomonas sp. TH10]|uniref:hypothetical protein n=1 Tax=Pseudomonas sp. TH10 TaxID=2796376 RepID=UPI001911BEBF|nr:hypothetical protein [Pseudomonas sp. TH10]MBK5516704.1 hypothetical protein [Pseudomonas sp. TH10]
MSLEALKNACDRNYNAEYGYSKPIKAILNQGLDAKAREKAKILIALPPHLDYPIQWIQYLKYAKGSGYMKFTLTYYMIKLKLFPLDVMNQKYLNVNRARMTSPQNACTETLPLLAPIY